MRIERRHLEVLLAVAEAGSISKAAAALGVAQPALTAQVGRIERALGGRLFERGNGGVTPTALGHEILARSQALLAQFQELCQASWAQAARTNATQTVRFAGVPSAFTAALLPRAIEERLEGCRLISLSGMPRAAIVTMLGRAEVDAAILHEFPGHPLVLPESVGSATLLAVEPVFILVRGSHPLAGRREVDLAELALDDWVEPLPEDDGLHEQFLTACLQAGFTPRIGCFTVDQAIALKAVADGLVSGAYPTVPAVDGESVLVPRGTPMHRRVVLAWSETSPHAGLIRDLSQCLVAKYEELVLSRPQTAPWWRENRDLALHGWPARRRRQP